MLLLAAICTVPTFALLGYDAWHAREQQLAAAKQDLYARAKAVASEIGRDIRGAQLLLHALAQAPERLREGRRACEEQLRGLGSGYAEIGSIFAVSVDGKLLCSSGAAAGSLVVADRDYFVEALATDAPVVGRPTRARRNPKRFILPIALALRDASGSVQAVLAFGLNLSQYAASLGTNASSSTLLTLWDSSARLVYRWPDPERSVAEPPKSFPLGKALLDAGSGSLVHDGLDGIERVHGVDLVVGSDLRLSLSASKDELLAGETDAFIRNLGILWLIAAAAFGAAWIFGDMLIRRPLGKLARLAQRMSEGDLQARSGMRYANDEVGSLVRSFDTMAGTLATQFESLKEGERRVRESLLQAERAEQRVRQQLAHMKLLDDITRSIQERLDLKSIFQVVVRTIEDSLAADFCCIALHDPEANVVRIEHIGAKSRERVAALDLDENTTVAVDTNGLARVMTGEFVYESDISSAQFAFVRRLSSAKLRSLALAPLRAESSVLGFLLAAREPSDAFSSSECEFLRQLSEHVALAAQQARLYAALQQAYDDLRQTQQVVMQEERLRALGQMASGIAHDINNALSPVSLYTSSLLDGEPNLSERARSYLETIQRAVDDVAETVARMREFYRKREEQIALAPVDLNQVVRQVIELTRPRWSDMAQGQGIHIRQAAELEPGLPQVLGVESEIREALTNLVFNAVDAMPQGGALRLRTRTSTPAGGAGPSSAIVEVHDEGVGMDAATRQRCLEPFFTTKGERGTGLGLAMVFGIAQRHHAALEIDSEPGAGTCVRLVFPVLAPGQGAERERRTQGERIAARMRILAIDDDPILLRSLRETLEADGHLVVSANGGEEGIAAFRDAVTKRLRLDVVITDLGMPGIDGHKVASAIKKAAPSTPVVMLTGWGRRLAADGALPPFVDRLLAKPPKLPELRRVLAELQSEAREEIG